MKYPDGFWSLWPLVMAFGFTCITDAKDMAAIIPQILTIVFLTYTITLRVLRSKKP